MTDVRGATAVPDRGSSGPSGSRPGLLSRLSLFYRQIVAELRKVIWPTRKELITYTSVVIVFVLVVMSYVALLDLGFGRLSLWVFG